ncbi:integrin beta-2 isoform X2 [Takifugu flavidus]|nr:integrin beta-2 isoform X2 [Takifugu flavidus]XP_056893100.1 integrin beta-2 isoform X2 [Takifugu flavidus]XP_056893186.1 integrin beta-2 isoform X2 [Takifugu flavidus]XP_056893271.1 integrin beta-2 isoform X2 [Takifugu flavidus]TWW81159.1 Integrin beta-2 [Takifugu flavidus]
MGLYQVFFLFLLMGKNGLCQVGGSCSKTVVNSCSDCIRSGPDCAWCMQENFTQPGEQETVRCNTRALLTERGCEPQKIIAPHNNVTVVKELPLSESFEKQEPIQLSPQVIHLKVRPGSPATFRVSFKRVQGYPVDLYYLMDLSNSMKDDLDNVKDLGNDLLSALKTITAHAQIGFGAFVDKTVLPYTNTNEKKLLRPCDDDSEKCQAAFGYRHVLSLTPREQEFKQSVTNQFISGNLDSPEGGLDAMMQAAVCGGAIGWRNSSTRLIVLTTDAGFHMAGDGKLAGILEPNDQQCHMKDNLYYKSNEMDYPSVGQLAFQLEKNNIQTIFAVTENVQKIYKQLSAIVPKSEVGVLSNDSNNVVELIKTAYRKLSSKITLTHDRLPDNVRITYTPECQSAGPPGPDEGVCDNVKEKQEVSFNVTVVVDSCIKDTSFPIRILGIKDTLTVSLSTSCECDCNDPQDSQHQSCGGKGSLTCGVCSCQEGFIGRICECAIGKEDKDTLRKACLNADGVECGGRGECVCGRCQCHGNYHGDHCECDDEHCEKFQNQLCGGNGKCKCGVCSCNEGYEGSACQCKVSQTECKPPNGTVCHGRGVCRCSRCECDAGYQRPHCKTCLGCPDPCQTKLNCIECLGFNIGPFKGNCSKACSTVVPDTVSQLNKEAKHCELKDSESCWIKFSLEQLDGVDTYKAVIQSERVCPEPPSVTAIIGAAIGSVALIGLVLLMLVKFFIYIKDVKEFRKFEKEKKKSKWTDGANPLFKNATTTTTNPIFTGE